MCGCTPSHIASNNGFIVLVERFIAIDHSVIHFRDDANNTALRYATEASHKGAIKLLIDAEASVEARDDNGTTPLHHFAEQYHNNNTIRCEHIVDLFINAGADINAQNNEGEISLDFAKNNTAISVLKSRGAELSCIRKLQEREEPECMGGTTGFLEFNMIKDNNNETSSSLISGDTLKEINSYCHLQRGKLILQILNSPQLILSKLIAVKSKNKMISIDVDSDYEKKPFGVS